MANHNPTKLKELWFDIHAFFKCEINQQSLDYRMLCIIGSVYAFRFLTLNQWTRQYAKIFKTVDMID